MDRLGGVSALTVAALVLALTLAASVHAGGGGILYAPPAQAGGGGTPRSDRIRVSGGTGTAARYLVWRGRPLVLVGDSVTQGWMETGTDFDYEAYLDALAVRGINATMLWSFIGTSPSRQRADSRIGYDAPTLWPWCRDSGDGDFDLACFQDEYFDQLRGFVTAADQRDIAVVITVHDGWTKTRFDYHPFNVANGGPLGDRDQYVELARYEEEMPVEFDGSWSVLERNQYYQERFCARLLDTLEHSGNVIYEIFNEGEWYASTQRLEHERHFLQFFAERTRAPLFSNTDHMSGDNPRRNLFVTALSFHKPGWNASSSALEFFEHFTREARDEVVKPVVFTETVPEFQGDSAALDGIMRALWGALMGGAQVLVQDDVSFRFAPQTQMIEFGEEGDELLDRIGYAADFFRDLNITAMAPDPKLCSTRVCLARKGFSYIVYTQNTDPVQVDLRDVSVVRVKVSWLDPRNGEVHGRPAHVVRGVDSFTPPVADAVLRLEAVAQSAVGTTR